jgi:hypothetical protein
MATNLPPTSIEDSAAATKLFFDTYGKLPLEFSANEVDAAIGFFEGKGFDRSASIVIAAAILKQAKLDETPVFKILDTLKVFNSIQLSGLVTEILNNNRPITSTLGFRLTSVSKDSQLRNIAP